MDAVDAAHTKVNLYQFITVSLQQMNRPNVQSLHD